MSRLTPSVSAVARQIGLSQTALDALNDLDATELGFLNGVTAGTALADKALVINSSKGITGITSMTVATMTAPIMAGSVVFADGTTDVDIASHDATNGLKLGGTLVTSSAAELNILDGVTSTATELNLVDITAQTETTIASGTASVTKRITKLDSSAGSGSFTLAAPDATMIGQVKIIEMVTAGNALTLALTNIQGQSSGTSASFDATGETLTLVGGTTKWTVTGEAGVTLS